MIMQYFTEKTQFTTYTCIDWCIRETVYNKLTNLVSRYQITFTTFLDLGLEKARGLPRSVVFPQSLLNGQRILNKMQRLKVNGK